MNGTRVIAIARRIINQLRRDHRTIGLLVVVPIVVLTLLGWAFRSQTGPIPVGFVREGDDTIQTPLGPLSLGQRLENTLAADEQFKVVVVGPEEARAQLKDGRVKVVIFVDKDATRRLIQDRRLVLRVTLEGSEPQTSATIMSNLNRVLAQTLEGFASQAQAGPAMLKDIEVDFLHGGEEFDVLDYFAPSLIAFFVFFLVYMLTAVSFLRERSQGTIERLMATPVSRAEIVLGYMLGFILFASLQSLVVLLFTVYVLGIHYTGNLLVVFVVELILTVGAVNLGIFLSTFARNELQVVQFIPLIILPQVFLSGIFWTIRDMPQFLQPFAYIMPLTYANSALRDVMIKGFGFDQPSVLFNLAILVVFALAMIFLSATTIRRQVA